MKQFSLQVNGKPATTNDAGVFEIALQNETKHVIVSLQNNSYFILYPTGGFVPVPRDVNDLPEIIIGNPMENHYLDAYIKVYKEIKSGTTSTATELVNLTKRLDSIQHLLLELHYSESDLRDAKEIQDGKDKYYPEIAQNLIEFRNKAIDLKRALKHTSDYAFDHPPALQQLFEAVTNYKNARNLLDQQHLNYEKYIIDYWQSDALKKELHELTSYALDSVHKAKFLTAAAYIEQINQFFQGNRDKELKARIQQNINNALPGLENCLAELERRTDMFLTKFSE